MKRLLAVLAVPLVAATLLAPAAQAQDYCVSGERGVRELYVAPGEVCEFDPQISSTLKVTAGSILVEGTLRMRPASHDVMHRIVFENVNEEGFKGAGLGPSGPSDPILKSDPGLWVMRQGVLDIVGSKKTGWTRNPASAIGWKSKCDLRIAPTKEGDLDSRPWEFGNAVPRAHSKVPKAEVFNLTRNVVISGTPEGKSHVFIRSSKPQSIEFATLENMGPACDCPAAENGKSGPILGRWALHWHHSQDGSRGSIVRGTVIRDSDSRGYVPHQSNGIRFIDTIAYQVKSGGYWWDPHTREEKSVSRDILWRHILAGESTGSGILLGSGGTCPTRKDREACNQTGNVLKNSAAFGTAPDGFSSTAAGIQWSTKANSAWTLKNNVSHNNRKNIFWWDNTPFFSLIHGLHSYAGQSGSLIGAYGLNHSFTNLKLLDTPLLLHAAGVPKITGTFDMRGRSAHALEVSGSNTGSRVFTTVSADFRGYTGAHAVVGEVNDHVRRIQFVNSTNKRGKPLTPDDIDVTLRKPGSDRNDFIMQIKGPSGAWRSKNGTSWTAE